MSLKCFETLKNPVMEPFLTQFIPHMLNRVELRSIGREKQQAHVIWRNKRLILMPSCTIHDHDNPIHRVSSSHLVKEELRTRSIDVWKHEAVKLAVLDRYCAIGIGVLMCQHSLANRPERFWTPARSGVGNAPKTCFIHEHQSDGSFSRPLLINAGNGFLVVFFHSSCATGSDCG